jgi:sulfoxide reductase heme-binding subunit YedZ
VVALLLITASVTIGLTMATRILARPGLNRTLVKVHEQTALAGLVAIAIHGLTLLGDSYLHPGIQGIAVPFSLSYRPLFTGLGIIAGYLAALLGLSFYARRKIGVALWRKLHRATIVVWALGIMHTLGAGTDAPSPWLRLFLLASSAPVVFLALVRFLPGGSRQTQAAPMAGAGR